MKPKIVVKYKKHKGTEFYSPIETVTMALSPGSSFVLSYQGSTKKSAVNATMDWLIELANEAKIK